MPATKAYAELFAAGTSVAAGTTKAAPVVSNVIDTRTGYGGELIYRITNGGALGAPCTIMFQTSDVGGATASDWFDYYPVGSNDLVSGSVNQGPSVPLGKGVMYLRAIAYGNTTNACTVEAGLQHVTGL